MTPDRDEHLSELEIALLVSDQGSRALRQWLSEHVGDCESCRELLAQAVMACRPLPPHAAGSADGAATVTMDQTIRDRILDQLELACPATVNPPASTRLIPLRRRRSRDAEGGGALAAHAAGDAAELPALASDDGSILVHFRRPEPGRPIRAYVVRRLPAEPGGLWIVFPGRDISFAIGPDGEADLPGATPDDLAEGRLAIELRPLAAPADPLPPE